MHTTALEVYCEVEIHLEAYADSRAGWGSHLCIEQGDPIYLSGSIDEPDVELAILQGLHQTLSALSGWGHPLSVHVIGSQEILGVIDYRFRKLSGRGDSKDRGLFVVDPRVDEAIEPLPKDTAKMHCVRSRIRFSEGDTALALAKIAARTGMMVPRSGVRMSRRKLGYVKGSQ